MNKVININFQGRILPIEEQAYDLLKQYIESLRVYFANEEGRDEIINDIECRVAELCDERLKKGTLCITQEDMSLIITSIGRPADFEAQDGFEQSTTASTNSANDGRQQNGNQNTTDHTNSNFYRNGNIPKRLYRDEQNKVLGGVCSGIANYFVIEPWIVRILWFFLIGLNILIYIILWIAVPSSSVKEVGGVRKRLFRDIDNKIIGGVSAGLAKYFGIQVWIVRILFLIPFIRFVANFRHIHLFQFWEFPDFPNFLDITFSPGAVFIYIILWLVLPEAKSSADKLEMVGEKVDLNSIKNTIQNDMEGFSKRAQYLWGNEFYKTKIDQTAATTSDNNDAAENQKSDHQKNVNAPAPKKGILHFLGRLITITIKVFVFFVLGVVGISILAALFGIGVAGTSLLPLKRFLIEDGIQSVAAIGTILFFIWVPVIGIVTAVIRRFAGFKKTNKWVRASFIALWVLGWISIFYFFSSLGNSFSKHNQPVEENVQLTNPKVDFLRVTATPKMKYYEDKWFQITPFGNYGDEDTVFVRNLRVRIVQSKSDSFEIKVVKLSNGKTVKEANTLATNINFNLTQADSVLYLDRGIGISTKNKFRNQHIIMTIAVPVGKRILISSKGWSQTNVHINRRGMRTETIDRITNDNDWYDEWNEPWDNESFPYEHGVEYKMTAKGLEKLKSTEKETDDKEADTPKEMEEKLEKLKEERMQMEQNKLKGNTKIGLNTNGPKDLLVKKTSELLDLHWVLDRFSY